MHQIDACYNTKILRKVVHPVHSNLTQLPAYRLVQLPRHAPHTPGALGAPDSLLMVQQLFSQSS